MQNEDFVWHLVLGTLLSLFFGMRPAGQVCRGTALASAVCPPATLFFLSQAGGGLIPHTQAGGISKEVLLALFICGDEKE